VLLLLLDELFRKLNALLHTETVHQGVLYALFAAATARKLAATRRKKEERVNKVLENE